MRSQNKIDRILISFIIILSLSTGFYGIAAESTLVGDIAIKGFDAVAYFQDNKAEKGSMSFTFQWHNLTWCFLTEENRDLFVTNPEKYAPQYDGYCAWALTEARKAMTNPEVWRIVDGKLYLNCSQAAYDKWSRDIPGNIKKADTNWSKLNGDN